MSRSPFPFPTTVTSSAMFFPLLAAFSSYLHIDPASAQVTATNCTDEDYTWSLNTLQQSPCVVAAQLQGVCSNGVYDIPALQPPNVYVGPWVGDADQCICNTVVYNLVSACGACQGGTWIDYNEWSLNCSLKLDVPAGTFPEPVPADTRVPNWAYIDTSSDTWNDSRAEDRGDSPESTASITPTSTSQVSLSNITPGATGGGRSSTSTSSSKTGALAGGVVGAVLVLTLGVVIVAWFVVRRRHARSLPSDMSGQGGEIEQPTIEIPRPYDPSDPTTYPIQEYFSVNRRLDSTPDLRSNRTSYRGLPEIH